VLAVEAVVEAALLAPQEVAVITIMMATHKAKIFFIFVHYYLTAQI